MQERREEKELISVLSVDLTESSIVNFHKYVPVSYFLFSVPYGSLPSSPTRVGGTHRVCL